LGVCASDAVMMQECRRDVGLACGEGLFWLRTVR
jgi:hypothetical protein